ncbi:hypothetical protein QC763_107130 [Podospora pseudopauciseta]|uniref:Uncharacterized protein n=1 Tax=Podospora pseudopauciseta TaxID=2093780 RepID=A0ABR0HYG1_9PEZI|nr:hypothetical protein QC763_107130 [Podospora pseudopauciseta]
MLSRNMRKTSTSTSRRPCLPTGFKHTNPPQMLATSCELRRRLTARCPKPKCFVAVVSAPGSPTFYKPFNNLQHSEMLLLEALRILLLVEYAVTANFSACVERLSKLLIDSGRAAPRYQEMALLYPQSRSLRSNMCKYFTVVVRLCHQLVMFTKQSIFQQLKAFLSDQKMTSFRDQLDHWAVSIKAEVWLLTNKSVEEQGLSLKAIMRSGKTRRAEKAKFKVLNYCSTYDYQSTWKELRKAGNTSLLQGSAEYHS